MKTITEIGDAGIRYGKTRRGAFAVSTRCSLGAFQRSEIASMRDSSKARMSLSAVSSSRLLVRKAKPTVALLRDYSKESTNVRGFIILFE